MKRNYSLKVGEMQFRVLICILSLLLMCQARSRWTFSVKGTKKPFNLTILHVNDVHAHFEEINVNAGRCNGIQAMEGRCYGGIARMYTKIKELTDSNTNALLLNAGDYYQGTIWYTMFKYKPVAEFANMLNYTAMGLGNHDFDDGIAGLKPLTEMINFDLLATNIEEAGPPVLLEKVKKSKIVDYGSHKVGIIGYVTKATERLSQPDDTLTFLDEIESVAVEARRLTEEGVDILIALGHAGYELETKMAREVPELDVVVGGHSHTFLYTGNPPPESVELIEGPYPTYVKQLSGKFVPVVQAYAYTKYMGHLRLQFDAFGELLLPVEGAGVNFADVILLDDSIPPDPAVENAMQKYRDNLTYFYEVIGSSQVDLTIGHNTESNLGNLITDALVNAWNGDVQIGFITTGGIRSTISEGNVTREDIYNVLPFNNTVDKVSMNGTGIKMILENCASRLCANASCPTSSFLHISGLQVSYEVRENNAGNRLSRCQYRCRETQWCDIVEDDTYKVAIQDFLTGPGGSTAGFPDYILDQEVGSNDAKAFEEFVTKNSPICQTTEDRIIIHYYEDE